MIRKIRNLVSTLLKEDQADDFYHAERTYNLGMRIAWTESCDRLVVGAACYLHDLHSQDEKKREVPNWHVGREALSVIEQLLLGQKFPPDKIPAVLLAVELHETYSLGGNLTAKPNNIEGLILQDADRLDAIGAVGIARAFTFSGMHNKSLWDPSKTQSDGYDPTKISKSTLHHFYEKLLKLKYSMNTREGKRIAEDRHRYMEEYITRFLVEWEGKV